MGYVYEFGITEETETGDKTIVKPNLEKALTYYKKAAEQNFPRGLNNLASFYFNNREYKN